MPGSPALQYGWPEGSKALRGFIAGRLRERGAAVDAESVIITNGAQQAIALAVDVLSRHHEIQVDDVSYPAALDLFKRRNRRVTTRGRVSRLAYVMPVIGNPTGLPMTKERRASLFSSQCLIIEDDAYAELDFGRAAPRPLLADAPLRTFHVGTFSKTLCPGLRVGWLIAPLRWRRRIIKLKQAIDLQPSSLSQLVLEQYLEANDYERRLARLRAFYRRRADRLARAVHAELPSWRFDEPAGGFGLWITADAEVDEVKLMDAAVAEGVSFDPGSLFSAVPGEYDGPARLRLTFSLAEESDLAEGVKRLRRAWQRARANRRTAKRAATGRSGVNRDAR